MFGCVKRLFPLDISSKGLLGQNSFAVCVCVCLGFRGGSRALVSVLGTCTCKHVHCGCWVPHGLPAEKEGRAMCAFP